MGTPIHDSERGGDTAANVMPQSAPEEDPATRRAALRDHARRMADDERASKGDSVRSKWYVVQVVSGKERRVCELLAHHVGADVIEECFCPAYATQRKVKGEWQECQMLLFPGYVIVVTRDATELKARLGSVTEFTRLLSLGGRFTALTDAERAWICAYTQRGDRVMPMSMAVSDGDQIRVVQGPLLGHEAFIDHVDRRRSTAYIELEMFGRKIKTKIGLGVVAKKPCSEGQMTSE